MDIDSIELGILFQVVSQDSMSYQGYGCVMLSSADQLKQLLSKDDISIANCVVVDGSVVYHLSDVYSVEGGYTQRFMDEIEELFVQQLLLNHVTSDDRALA